MGPRDENVEPSYPSYPTGLRFANFYEVTGLQQHIILEVGKPLQTQTPFSRNSQNILPVDPQIPHILLFFSYDTEPVARVVKLGYSIYI